MICFLWPEKLILSVQRRQDPGVLLSTKKESAEKDRRRAVRHRIAAMKMRADEVGVAFFIDELFFVGVFLSAGQTGIVDRFEFTSAPFASEVLRRHFLESNRGGEESDNCVC